MQQTSKPAPQILTDWSIRRSGPCMTITGKAHGAEAKVSGVYLVSPSPTVAGAANAQDAAGNVLAVLV